MLLGVFLGILAILGRGSCLLHHHLHEGRGGATAPHGFLVVGHQVPHPCMLLFLLLLGVIVVLVTISLLGLLFLIFLSLFFHLVHVKLPLKLGLLKDFPLGHLHLPLVPIGLLVFLVRLLRSRERECGEVVPEMLLEVHEEGPGDPLPRFVCFIEEHRVAVLLFGLLLEPLVLEVPEVRRRKVG